MLGCLNLSSLVLLFDPFKYSLSLSNLINNRSSMVLMWNIWSSFICLSLLKNLLKLKILLIFLDHVITGKPRD